MTPKYSLVEHDNNYYENHWAIEIKDGEYEGVVYQYDTVSFDEEDNGDVILSFNTITLNNPKDLNLTSESFESILGEILTEIIEEQLEQVNGEDGTGDTETSTQQ